MVDESRETCNKCIQIKFKTSIIRSNLCDYSDAYIHVKGTIQFTNTAAQGISANNRNKGVTFKNCAPFINCINRINNTQVDDAHDIDVVMLAYKLLEYSKVYGNAIERNQL